MGFVRGSGKLNNTLKKDELEDNDIEFLKEEYTNSDNLNICIKIYKKLEGRKIDRKELEKDKLIKLFNNFNVNQWLSALKSGAIGKLFEIITINQYDDTTIEKMYGKFEEIVIAVNDRIYQIDEKILDIDDKLNIIKQILEIKNIFKNVSKEAQNDDVKKFLRELSQYEDRLSGIKIVKSEQSKQQEPANSTNNQFENKERRKKKR